MNPILQRYNLKHINQTWLNDCTEYIESTGQPVVEGVWAQILHSDLSSMVSTSLFPPFESSHKYKIQSKTGFIFQIIGIHEVGLSNQTMLDALKDGSKLPRKMLKFTLSDGIQHVLAMELKFIGCLSLETPLGCKVTSY